MPLQAITDKDLLRELPFYNSSIEKAIVTNKKKKKTINLLWFCKGFLKERNITKHSKALVNYACSYMVKVLNCQSLASHLKLLNLMFKIY